MSQKATRKSQNTTASEEKDKVNFETPVKEMKKKLAVNAEKDKQAAEKVEKTLEKNDTADKNKSNDKIDKHTEKSDKQEKVTDKKTEKVDKNADKKAEKVADKSAEKKVEKTADKNVEKVDKSAEKKVDKPAEKKSEQPDKNENVTDKAKESPALNGNAQARGDANGNASDGSSDELVIEDDEHFPELAYDDSETEMEPDAPSRSHTRRSQVKVTKTPETPRPASDKDGDDSKELEKKLLKLKDEVVPPSDRKLRSADSPKPDAKKLEKKQQESPKKQDTEDKKEEDKKAPSKKDLERELEVEQAAKPEEKADKSEMEVVIEVEAESSAKRARVSPYSRPRHDRTSTSVMAEYSGNNSTMETTMDITESSFLEEPSLNDSGYLRGLRGIRGRSSYKQLKEVKLTNPNANRPRPPPQVSLGRPTGAVVGRKRKPSADTASYSPAVDSAEEATDELFAAHGKRMRLLDRLSISMPFRRTRHAAEIVGINTDLPLTAPVASTSLDSFDPETIKPAPAQAAAAPVHDRSNARCVVM